MSRTTIFSIYILLDVLIIAGVVWGVFHRLPVRQYFIPAAVLFVLGGVWLIVMTIRHTPPGNS